MQRNDTQRLALIHSLNSSRTNLSNKTKNNTLTAAGTRTQSDTDLNKARARKILNAAMIWGKGHMQHEKQGKVLQGIEVNTAKRSMRSSGFTEEKAHPKQTNSKIEKWKSCQYSRTFN